MKTPFGHLSYCTNIHPGESWKLHFEAIRKHIPIVKKKVSPEQPFGIGLRLSNLASLELTHENNLSEFKRWLDENNCYVFTMNGFPYGGFHHTKVKDHVHQPDWTTQDRVVYTLRLFNLLKELLPTGLDGGISTSPLSYKYWHTSGEKGAEVAFKTSTENILKIVPELIRIKEQTGKSLHLDIEPEPDGLIESGPEFMDWFLGELIPMGAKVLATELNYSESQAEAAIREHIQLCYDICHFAVGYEEHAKVIKLLRDRNIRVGKIQISAALKAPLPPVATERQKIVDAFRQFNESTYLHQVVALHHGTELVRYRDLSDALNDSNNASAREWRSHFHVPLFINEYGVLKSTQSDVTEVLEIHKRDQFTNHLEIETYTWEALPPQLKLPIDESIIRELEWVQQNLVL